MVKWLQGSIRWLRLGTCWAQNPIGPELGLLGDLLNGCHFWCVCWTLGIFHGVGHRETLWGALDPAKLSARHWLPITPQEPSKGPGAWMQLLLKTMTYFLLSSVMASLCLPALCVLVIRLPHPPHFPEILCSSWAFSLVSLGDTVNSLFLLMITSSFAFCDSNSKNLNSFIHCPSLSPWEWGTGAALEGTWWRPGYCP